MYTVSDYLRMVADKVRIDAYERAIAATVRRGDVVVDLGTGLGVMAILACRHGASRVYAIEPAGIAQTAIEVIGRAGLTGSITVIDRPSEEVELPERANVIVSDLRGTLPHFGSHLATIIDARRRFLAEGGTMIPRRDTLFAALVDDDRLHPDARLAAASDASGVDFTAAREHLVSARVTARVTSDRLVSAPAPLAVIDYTGVTDSNLDGAARLVATRAGQCHGFAVWFDAELAPGIGFSNAPGSAELLYGRIFFPFSEAVELSEGSDVMLGLTAKRIAADYLWRWTTTLETQGGTRSFNQSSLGAEPILSSRLRQSSDAAVPAAWKELELDRAILALVDGSRPTREIAERVAEIAGGYDIALDRVVSLVERLGVKR